MQTATDILTNNPVKDMSNTIWGKRIIAAEKRGHFTDFDLRMAESWVTCACGKSSNVQSMPYEKALHEDDAPSDTQLRRLGKEFYSLIYSGINKDDECDEFIIDSARTLVDIEERALYLLMVKQ